MFHYAGRCRLCPPLHCRVLSRTGSYRSLKDHDGCLGLENPWLGWNLVKTLECLPCDASSAAWPDIIGCLGPSSPDHPLPRRAPSQVRPPGGAWHGGILRSFPSPRPQPQTLAPDPSPSGCLALLQCSLIVGPSERKSDRKWAEVGLPFFLS